MELCICVVIALRVCGVANLWRCVFVDLCICVFGVVYLLSCGVVDLWCCEFVDLYIC